MEIGLVIYGNFVMCQSKGPVYFHILGEFTSNPIRGREDLVTHVKFKLKGKQALKAMFDDLLKPRAKCLSLQSFW